MPVSSCEYLLFGKRHSRDKLRDVLRHVLPELNRMNPEGLRRCAASGRFRWLIWRDGKRFHVKQSYRDFLRLAPDLWANVRWVTRRNLRASCQELIEQIGYPGASFKVIGFGDSASGRTTAGEAVNVEGSTPEGPGLSRGVHKGTDLVEGLVAKLKARYAEFFNAMGVDPALRYGCPPEWGWERFRDSRDSCQTLLRRGEDLPSENPLSYLAFSNIYKWAWHGAENTLQQKSTQKFLDRTKEVELILDEIRILDPDIVVLQSSRFSSHSFGPIMNAIDRLTGKAYVLVHRSHYRARHPERITRPLPYAAPAGRYGI